MNVRELLRKADLLGLTIIVGAVVAYSVQSVWNTYQTVAVVVGALLVVVSLALKMEQLRAGLGRRSTKFGLNSAASALLLLGVLGFINYLGAENPQRFDLTTEKIFSLAEQSVNVASQLDEDVHIRAFFPQGEDNAVRNLLELFGQSSSRISHEFVDPDRRPQLAEQYDVTVYGEFNNPMTGQTVRFGTVVLEMAGRTERVAKQSEPLGEEDITNALMKLVRGEVKVVYFVEGHGEKPSSGTEREGLDAARNGLEREGYAVETLNLVRVEEVPSDASVVVWPGPETEPFDEEIEIVDRYLDRGGSVFVMVDPAPASSLDVLLSRWSVSTGENFVVDASGVGRLLGAGPAIPMVSQYGTHAITESFNVMTFFPLARSISRRDPVEDGQVVSDLLTTGAQSWGESDMENTEASFDPESDLGGPVSVGLVVTRDLDADEKARLVVISDSDFATNAYFGLQGNGDLFLNAVGWLAEDEGFISVRPRAPTDRRLTLTAAQGRITYYISIVLLPLGILAAGVAVWMKRRSM